MSSGAPGYLLVALDGWSQEAVYFILTAKLYKSPQRIGLAVLHTALEVVLFIANAGGFSRFGVSRRGPRSKDYIRQSPRSRTFSASGHPSGP
jgi:hypothetical protein